MPSSCLAPAAAAEPLTPSPTHMTHSTGTSLCCSLSASRARASASAPMSFVRFRALSDRQTHTLVWLLVWLRLALTCLDSTVICYCTPLLYICVGAPFVKEADDGVEADVARSSLTRMTTATLVLLIPASGLLCNLKLAALPSIGTRSSMSGSAVCIRGKSSSVLVRLGTDREHTRRSMLGRHARHGYIVGSSTCCLACSSRQCTHWSGLRAQARATTYIG